MALENLSYFMFMETEASNTEYLERQGVTRELGKEIKKILFILKDITLWSTQYWWGLLKKMDWSDILITLGEAGRVKGQLWTDCDNAKLKRGGQVGALCMLSVETSKPTESGCQSLHTQIFWGENLSNYVLIVWHSVSLILWFTN